MVQLPATGLASPTHRTSSEPYLIDQSWLSLVPNLVSTLRTKFRSRIHSNNNSLELGHEENMSNAIARLEALTKAPPKDPAERLNIYNAARKLVVATEDPFNTICRVNGSVSQFT